MASQFVTTKRSEYIQLTAGTGISYATLIIGYLYTILTTTHLTLLNFLVFTALQVGYFGLILWLFRAAQDCLNSPRFSLGMALLVVMTEAICLLTLIGLQWDWLLFLVTVAIFFTIQPLRLAAGVGVLLYGTLVVDLGLQSRWNWLSFYPSLLSFLPAFAFVAIFSLIVRASQEQKDRAERLLDELERSKAELEQAHAQLQAYAGEVEELTIVRERTRMAREIHDILGHYLSILTIQLETIAKLQERDPARAVAEIAEARRVAAQSMQEVRNAVAALRPTSIATLGLSEALAQLGAEFERSALDTTLTLDLETELPALSPDISMAFYRATQEALTNIRKHALASKVLVRLRYEDDELELLVQDNGRGSVTDTQSGAGFGLVGLRERIELLGGQVWHGPAEQGGYRLTACAPVPPTPPALPVQTHIQPEERIRYGSPIGQ